AMIHGHGDDASLQTVEILDDFSVNIRFDGPPPALLDHLRSRMDLVARYPEPDARSYRRELAAFWRISESQILVTAGGVAAIHLLAQAHHGRRSLVLSPTFSEYADAAIANAHSLTRATRAELAASEGALLAGAEIVWLCNPNNPTGENIPAAELLALVDAHPATLFAIDQAFADFCAAAPVTPADAVARPNLVLLRSFTKTLGIPGLRLGCILSSEANVAFLSRVNQPWAVNSLAIEAGLFHLEHPDLFALPLDDMLAEARSLMRAIDALPGYAAHPSATVFFLVSLRRGRALALKEYLVRRYRILVRDASNFVGLVPEAGRDAVRISSRTARQNARLVQALASWQA
ncbi:MAG: aminotransferase class I/II-fold pyridoxal phosphate-dependent enzyme, partial [Candidatus Accumulibacter sp.]|nr:aminotransferase class I/II-fold pyridoxal phosphate-dependent enzyme [Accumulibacter sp.]